MGRRFDPAERHSEDLIAAIEDASQHVAHVIREGFLLLALQIASAQGAQPDNSKAIEAQVDRLKGLTSQLKKSTTP
jgi:hypothetical protein